ncbi:MAG TPA: DnaB-like helicase C-terminal domain-containing protein [Devosia sp.]|nr:DnaB-like helicase C-terminal domain-containing protein [Devosia sp.]
MNAAASQIVLSEADVELTLLGSLFINDGAFEQFAPVIKAEWFGDSLAQYLYVACLRIHDAGHRLTPPTIMAALPTDLGGIGRGELYARACSVGLPTEMISGLVATLKDRWARRSLVQMADNAKDAAMRFEADPYDVASECLADLDNLLEVKSEKVGGSLYNATQALFADIANPDSQRGATTGVRILDFKLNGYRRGQLYVIAGRPGMGKSAFMCSSLRRTAESGTGVAIFSLEMTRQEIAARMISDACDSTSAPHFGSLLKGDVPEDKQAMAWEASEAINGAPMHIDDSARLTFAQIAAKARRLKSEMAAAGVSLGVVCIDHMGLVTPSDRYAGNKVAEAGEVSGRARALAKELDCCVILLCQLSREVEKRDDKRPIMSDLRWSGEIEQDAHVIGFLYREAYYLAQDPNAEPHKLADARWAMEFLIRKNRNGETSDVRLWCSIAHSSIRDNT